MERDLLSEQLKAIEQDVRRQIDEAYDYANKSPFPPGEHALEDLFV